MSKLQSEINLIDFIFTLFKYKIMILSIIAFSCVSMLIYNATASPIFKVESSFILPTQSGGSGNPLLGYAKTLGISMPSNISQYIFAISQSGNLHGRIVSDVEKYYPNKTKNEIYKILNFKDSVSLKKNNHETFILKIENKNPEIAIAINKSFLQNLKFITQELEITAQKKIITILDAPNKPSKPYKPRKLLNIIFAIIGSTTFSISLVFFIEYIKDELEHRDKQ
jgi:uncharacterized protein involved in exopolysaccharide biosynthesis